MSGPMITRLRPARCGGAFGRRRRRRARDPGGSRQREDRRSRSSATARAACSGWSRWSKSRRRRAASPMARSRRATSPGLFDGRLPAGRRARAAPRPDGRDPLSQEPGAPDLRALRHHRSAVARRLRRAWRLSRPRNALEMQPLDIVEAVTDSGLRGRGGAGFPTGIKWKTVLRPQGRPEIHRLQRRRRRLRHLRRPHDDGRRSVRADRGHDHRRARGRRHQGLHLSPLANIRTPSRTMQRAIADRARRRATSAPTCAAAARRSTSKLRLGAGAYICGEETSLLESLEGKRGMVRSKPPLPAIEGLFGKPTVVNNVLSLAAVPIDPGRGRRVLQGFRHGPLARHACRSSSPATSSAAAWSRRRSASPCARLIYDFGGGTASRAGRSARCRSAGRWAPTSRRSLLDTPLDYEAFAAQKGMLGHGGIVVFDDTVDMAQQARFAMEFCAIEILRQVHALPHRLDPRRRGDRPDHRRRGPRRRISSVLRRSVRDDAGRLAVRAGRADAVPGAERAQALPRRFRPRAA